MTQLNENTIETAETNDIEEISSDSARNDDWGNFTLGWISTLSLVFLTGATLNTFMMWCSYGKSWDLAGTIFSGILAFLAYHFTISAQVKVSRSDQWKFAVFLPAVWALVLPIILNLMGYK
ncbi:MAG: hypothetical protein HQM10_20685 [Candidatus Riflebacteria bacterium]|nr:hypothetical protein [Candidatus Riflebacteria bacterium]